MVGSLDFKLTADGSQVRSEFSRIRTEANALGSAVSAIFGNEAISAAGFRVASRTIVGVIDDLDELNAGLSLTESLTRNAAAGFQDLGDIALLEFGKIAQFLGGELFETPLAGLQQQSLDNLGIGQLSDAFQILSAGSNAAKAAAPALDAFTNGLRGISGTLGDLQSKALAGAIFFQQIGGSAEDAKDLLVAAAKAIDDAIDRLLDSIAQVSPEFATLRSAAKDVGVEFSVGQSIFGDWIDDAQRVENAAKGISSGLEFADSAAGEMRINVNSAGDAVADFAAKLARQQRGTALFTEGMRDLADAATLFDAWQQASEIFDGFFGSIEDVFNAAKEAENLANRLQVTSTSARGAGEDLEFLSGLSEDLGINFNATAEGFAQFSAAAQQTSLSGEQVKVIFEDVAQSAAVMRLSVADTEGVFLALRQTISGGNVQLEELNQLAERIPGAMQSAQAALNSLGFEGNLRDVVSSGEVDSVAFVEAFAQQLAAQSESGVVGAATSAEAAVNRFQNALGELQIQMGQTWIEIGTPALEIFADALSFAAENEEKFSTAIDALLVAAALRGAGALVTMTRAAIQGAGGIGLFAGQVQAAALKLGAFALQTAAAYAATLVFFQVLDRFKSGAEDAETAIASLDRALGKIAEASGETAGALDIAPSSPPPTDFIDATIFKLRELREEGGLTGNILATALESTFLGVGTGINRAVNFFRTGQFELVTNAEKQLNDQLVKIGEFSERVQDVVGESLELEAEFKLNGTGAIAELRDLQQALDQIAAEKLTIDPEDSAAIEDLAKREEDLLKRRAEAQKEVTERQSALNVALEQARQIQQSLDPQELGSEGFEQANRQQQANINLLEQQKAKFDELAASATKTAETITRDFKTLNAELERSFLDSQTAAAEALAGGSLNDDEARQQDLQAEKEYLDEKLRLNKEQAAELRTELERNEQLRQIDPSAATLDAGEAEKLQSQLEQLETETAQTRLRIAQNTRDEKQQVLEDELEDLRQANAEAEAVIQKSQNDRIAAIRSQQLDGGLSSEDADAQIAAVRQESIADEIGLLKDRLSQVQALKAQEKLSAEDAAQQERDLQQELSALNLRSIESELEAREAATRREIELIEQRNQAAEAAISESQNERIAAIRAQQLNSGVSEEDAAREAQRQIAQVEASGVTERLGLRQQELRQIQDLRERGLLNAREAAEREAELNQEVGRLNIQRLESELEARRALADQQRENALLQIENTLGAERDTLGISAESGRGRLDLLSAQLSLQQALGDLEQSQLQTRIAAAEASGDSLGAERLRSQLQAVQSRQLEEQSALAKEQLELQLQIQRVEIERAEIEAQIALAEAEANQESEVVLQLRRQQVELASQALSNQDAIADAQRRELDARQANNREQQQQAEISQRQTRIEAEQNRLLGERSRQLGAISGQLSETDPEQAQQAIENAQERLQLARRAGVISGQDASEAQRTIGQVRRLSGASDTQILREAVRNQGNDLFQQLLGDIGRGDIASLAGLAQPTASTSPLDSLAPSLQQSSVSRAAEDLTSNPASGETLKLGQQQLQTLGEIRDRLGAIETLATKPTTLNVTTPNPVADAARIQYDIAANAARRKNL